MTIYYYERGFYIIFFSEIVEARHDISFADRVIYKFVWQQYNFSFPVITIDDPMLWPVCIEYSIIIAIYIY